MKKVKLNNTFFEKHSISFSRFCKLIEVSRYSVKKYMDGEEIDDEKKVRIEAAVKVFEDLKLVYPDIRYYIKNDAAIKTYHKNKKKAYTLDKKFNTAFKKALK